MTTTTTSLTPHSTQILKTDKRGHIQFPTQMREDILDRFENSGMSGAEFAKFYNISYSTFATWRRKRNLHRKVSTSKKAFMEVALPERKVHQTGGVKVELPGGASLRVQNAEDAALAAQLLRALGEKTC